MTNTAVRDTGTTTDGHSDSRISSARDRVRDTATSARERASSAYSSARERTSTLYGSARDRASSASRRTSDTLSRNPLAAVAGGIAIGAILAAVLPKSRREVQAIGTAGARLNDKAREAAKTATDASRQKLDELGYQTVKDKLADFVGSSKGQQSQGQSGQQKQQSQQSQQGQQKQQSQQGRSKQGQQQ